MRRKGAGGNCIKISDLLGLQLVRSIGRSTSKGNGGEGRKVKILRCDCRTALSAAPACYCSCGEAVPTVCEAVAA